MSYPLKMQLSEEAEAFEALFSQDHWLENSFEQPRESFSAEEGSNAYSSSAPLKLDSLSALPAELHYSKEINLWSAYSLPREVRAGFQSPDPKACSSIKAMQ